MKTDWIRINDRTNYVKPIKTFHPQDPRYLNYWKEEKRRIIEGHWVYDYNGWRYMPAKLYFTVNHGTIMLTDEEQRTRYSGRPNLNALFWEFGYISLESLGFSGFKNSNVTCSKEALRLRKTYTNINSRKYLNLFKSDGTFKEYCEPREYMRILHEENYGLALYENSPMNITILGSRSGGKALLHGSIIKTINGDVLIEDIKIGDSIFGADGKETNVVGVYPQGIVPIYEIEFRSGRKVKCCENHLWQCYTHSNKEKTTIVDTKTMFKDYRSLRLGKPESVGNRYNFKYSVPLNAAVEYPSKELPIDPYIIGCLLGDGHISDRYVNKIISLTTHESDLEHYLKNFILPEDTKTRLVLKQDTRNFTIFLGHSAKHAFKKLRSGTHLFQILDKLGMCNTYSYQKRVPKEYMYGDTTQRLRLLQGLMDTDGYVQKRRASHSEIMFTSSNPLLAQDVADLARSLGYPAKMSKHYENEHQGYTNVAIYSDDMNIFLLPRKRDAIVKKVSGFQLARCNRDKIINITKIEDGEATCIMVDNKDKLFLTDNFVVTHNSFWGGNAELAHELITGSAKVYDEKTMKNPGRVTLLVGSGEGAKSSELCTKVKDVFTAFGEDTSLGVYGKLGEDDYTPSPFFLDMVGDIGVNNKDNPYRHEYKVRINGREVVRGTGNALHHVVYSEQKAGKKGGQAAAGGRYVCSVLEEQGLTPLLREAFRSNEATIQTDGIVFGRQIFFGTSENIEAVQPAKEIFTSPDDYRMIAFEDTYEHTGKIGFFLPASLTLKEASDEHGNIDLELANDILNKRRAAKAESSNPDLLRSEKLNYPLVPSEMWLGTKAKLLPYEEAANREKELLTNKLYQKIGKPITLRWDSKHYNGVTYEIDYNSKPIWEYPITNVSDVTGAIVVYDFPQLVNGAIPDDMYIYTHDPYIAEALDEGGSLGVTQVWLNQKYWSEYMINSPLVACYMGKHKDGKMKYYEDQEKLIAMYGNCNQMFYYEADRGEDCYNYYYRKNKLFLLAPRPQTSDSMYQQTTRKFGFTPGTRIEKLNKLASFHDFLLSETSIESENKTKLKVIETLPDIHLIREIMAFDIDGNFDAISASLGIVVANQQLEKYYKDDLQNKNTQREKNNLSFLVSNPMLFNVNNSYGNRPNKNY